MTEHPALMSKVDFARDVLRKSPSYVTALLKAGRLVMRGSGKHARVVVADSLALIAATTGARDDVAARHAALRGDEVASATLPAGSATAGSGEAQDPLVNLREQRALAEARRSKAIADQEEMTAAKMRGDLVAREDVEAAFRNAGAAVRSALDVLADQVAPLVAPVVDLDEVHALLQEAARNTQSAINQAVERQKADLAAGAVK